MNCVKCGRETAEEQVFCDVCLGEMEDYPVKPGTAVLIPNRNQEGPVKKVKTRRRPIRTLSEQLLHLKKVVLRLRILVAVLLLICGALFFLVDRMWGDLNDQSLPGQNYQTEEISAP